MVSEPPSPDRGGAAEKAVDDASRPRNDERNDERNEERNEVTQPQTRAAAGKPHYAAGAADNARIMRAAREAAAAAADSHTLNNLKSRYLGRNSELQSRLRAIGKLPKAERAAAGVDVNQLRQALEAVFADAAAALARRLAGARLAEESLDVTLPGRRRVGLGCAHPVQVTIERAVAILSAIGFETVEGPEIESDYYNFAALNFAPDHPARAMHDTFYLEDNRWLLRTHTSPVQVHFMEQNAGRMPIRAISPGKVFRRDSDATHSPMFHQIEGLWVDEQVSFTDLKGVLRDFFRAFFEDDDIVARFRPSFFPFTEPSAECDIRRGGSRAAAAAAAAAAGGADAGGAESAVDGASRSRNDEVSQPQARVAAGKPHYAGGGQNPHYADWLEIAGCGMVHPNVLEGVGIDSGRYHGFAFGMGVERMAMLYYGIDDIRLFFENDVRFLRQFA